MAEESRGRGLRVAVRKGGGRPPGFLWGVSYFSEAAKEAAECLTDCRHLSGSAGSAGAGEDRAPAGDDRCVLDEGGIGECGIRREPDQRESQTLQRSAVGLVLL